MSNDIVKLLNFIGCNRAHPAPLAIDLQQLGFAGFYFGLGGEDAALRQIYKKRISARQHGVYVDVGCNRPSFISNTYLFYCLGWRGLCIDADADLADEWRRIRPQDVFVASAVGEQTGAGFFLTKHKTNEGMHYVDAAPTDRGSDFQPPKPVQMRRLDDLFNEFLSGKRIDLMSMDIEGGELSALKSNDWTRWRPETIILECTAFDFGAPYADPAVAFLHEHGYRLHSKVGENVILIAG